MSDHIVNYKAIFDALRNEYIRCGVVSVLRPLVALGLTQNGKFNEFLTEGIYDPRLLCTIQQFVNTGDLSLSRYKLKEDYLSETDLLVINILNDAHDEKQAILDMIAVDNDLLELIDDNDVTSEMFERVKESYDTKRVFPNVKNVMKLLKTGTNCFYKFHNLVAANLTKEECFYVFELRLTFPRYTYDEHMFAFYEEYLDKTKDSVRFGYAIGTPNYIQKILKLTRNHPIDDECFMGIFTYGSTELKECPHNPLKIHKDLPGFCDDCWMQNINKMVINKCSYVRGFIAEACYVYFLRELASNAQNVEVILKVPETKLLWQKYLTNVDVKSLPRVEYKCSPWHDYLHIYDETLSQRRARGVVKFSDELSFHSLESGGNIVLNNNIGKLMKYLDNESIPWFFTIARRLCKCKFIVHKNTGYGGGDMLDITDGKTKLMPKIEFNCHPGCFGFLHAIAKFIPITYPMLFAYAKNDIDKVSKSIDSCDEIYELYKIAHLVAYNNNKLLRIALKYASEIRENNQRKTNVILDKYLR